VDLLIVLIVALPLAGFAFTVLVGRRLDHVPAHGHADHGAGHAGEDPRVEPGGEGHGTPLTPDEPGQGPAQAERPSEHRATPLADESMGPVSHHEPGDAAFRGIPTEEEQRATSPHAGHADDLANAEGAHGVIPPELNDGLGQPGHVAPGAESPRYRSWIVPTLLVGISWALSMLVFGAVIFGGETFNVALYTWIPAGDFVIEVEFLVDPLAAMLLLVVSSVGFLVHVYSIGYMNGDRGMWRFFAYLNLFMFSMLVLILGANFLLMYVGWELVGLCSYLLIGFWYKKPSAAGAAKKAFVVNRVGDFGFGLGVMMIWTLLGTLTFDGVFEGIGGLDEWQITVIALLLFAGAVGKSAQFPLHTWLPDAMEGPTPVSALIHAATMVNAGVYMVARSSPIFAEAPAAMWVVAGIGIFTAVLAAAIALTQNDIKKVLAYSTMSQLGYMFFALGIGAWVAAIFHLVTHGFFKGLLFMGSGSVIHGAGGEQDMRFMGGLRAKMPWTFATMVIGSLALSGVPIFAGFFSKDEILAESFLRGYYVLYGIGLLVAVMTAFYTFRMVFMTFWGEWRGPREWWSHVHESAPTMVVPLVILAVPSTIIGLIIGIPPEEGLIHDWLAPIFHDVEAAGILPGSMLAGYAARGEAHHFAFFGTGGLLLLAATIGAAAGIWLAYRWYVRDVESPRRFVERIPLGMGPGMYRASANRYYIDDIYNLVFARGGVLVSNALWWFDARVIDGAVDGAGWVSQRSGAALRRVQTGHVENYGLGIAAGLVVVLIAFLVAVR
jgi:NADH-quinone oxidoreductase subunit L